MILTGLIKKMENRYKNPIKYYIKLYDNILFLNSIIGNFIRIKHLGFECFKCKSTNIIYNMGYCKKCFFIVPNTNINIIYPELSLSHLNIERRDIKWEKSFELQPHVVYLSITSSIKVGVTQKKNILTRLMDQGAIESIIIAKTPNRYLAGVIENSIKKVLPDKTYFKKMLIKKINNINLIKYKNIAKDFFPKNCVNYFLINNIINKFYYPFNEDFLIEKNIKTINLKKIKDFRKKLIGIKGQYLIFDDGYVLNIRNHEGFVVKIFY